MEISADERRRAFSAWLRTGRLPLQSASDVEVKFNPWHDPDDGRFTFANSGRYFGGWLRGGFTGGGGVASAAAVLPVRGELRTSEPNRRHPDPSLPELSTR